MKKLLPIIIAILLLSSSATQGVIIIQPRRVVAAAGADYSDITFWWRAEGTTLSGTLDHTDGEDSVASAGSAVAINTDAAKVGTNGIDSPSQGDRYVFTDSTSGAWPITAGRIGFWLRVTDFTATCAIVQKWGDNTENIRFEMTGTDELHFVWDNDGETTITTTAANIGTGTWYLIEGSWDSVNNKLFIYVNGTQRASDEVTDITDMDAGSNFFGESNSCGSAVDFHIDNIMISNDPDRDFNGDCGEGTACKDLTAFPG